MTEFMGVMLGTAVGLSRSSGMSFPQLDVDVATHISVTRDGPRR